MMNMKKVITDFNEQTKAKNLNHILGKEEYLSFYKINNKLNNNIKQCIDKISSILSQKLFNDEKEHCFIEFIFLNYKITIQFLEKEIIYTIDYLDPERRRNFSEIELDHFCLIFEKQKTDISKFKILKLSEETLDKLNKNNISKKDINFSLFLLFFIIYKRKEHLDESENEFGLSNYFECITKTF